MQCSRLTRPLLPSFLFMYNLFTTLFRCNAPYIVFVFIHFLSISFSSLSFHCSIPVPYLNTDTVHAFIAVILFFPFSFDFRTNRSLRLYFFSFFFHFILFDLIQFFDLLHYFTILELYSFTSNYFSSLHGKNSTFFRSKLHPNVSTKDMNRSHKCIHLFFILGKQLQIIHEQQTIQLVFFLSPFMAYVYLSKYQRQRINKQRQTYSEQTTVVKSCHPEIFLS